MANNEQPPAAIDAMDIEAGEAELIDHMRYMHGQNPELWELIIERTLHNLRQHNEHE